MRAFRTHYSVFSLSLPSLLSLLFNSLHISSRSFNHHAGPSQHHPHDQLHHTTSTNICNSLKLKQIYYWSTIVSCRSSVDDCQSLVDDCQSSVDCRWSRIVSRRRRIVGRRSPVVSRRLSVLGRRLSVDGC